MKCPACFNELTSTQVGKVTVDVCQGGCGGIWFDAFELRQLDENHEEAGLHLLNISKQVSPDAQRKRDCPRCTGMKLKRHFFSARRQVEVDECPNCGGYWLDAGELAAIRSEKEQASKAAETNVSLAPEDIRYLYRLHISASGPSTGE